MLSRYAKAVVAWATGAVATVSVFVTDAAAQGDTWLQALVVAAIAALGSLGVAKVENKDV